MFKDLAIYAGGAAIGLWLSDFVIKNGPNDKTGFIDASPGFGLDDAAAIVLIVGGIYALKKLF